MSFWSCPSKMEQTHDTDFIFFRAAEFSQASNLPPLRCADVARRNAIQSRKARIFLRMQSVRSQNVSHGRLSKFMGIHKLIANGSFGPDEIRAMSEAYEAALVVLQLKNDQDERITELIAKSIINISAAGEREPSQMAERAINALGIRRPSAA